MEPGESSGLAFVAAATAPVMLNSAAMSVVGVLSQPHSSGRARSREPSPARIPPLAPPKPPTHRRTPSRDSTGDASSSPLSSPRMQALFQPLSGADRPLSPLVDAGPAIHFHVHSYSSPNLVGMTRSPSHEDLPFFALSAHRRSSEKDLIASCELAASAAAAAAASRGGSPALAEQALSEPRPPRRASSEASLADLGERAAAVVERAAAIAARVGRLERIDSGRPQPSPPAVAPTVLLATALPLILTLFPYVQAALLFLKSVSSTIEVLQTMDLSALDPLFRAGGPLAALQPLCDLLYLQVTHHVPAAPPLAGPEAATAGDVGSALMAKTGGAGAGPAPLHAHAAGAGAAHGPAGHSSLHGHTGHAVSAGHGPQGHHGHGHHGASSSSSAPAQRVVADAQSFIDNVEVDEPEPEGEKGRRGGRARPRGFGSPARRPSSSPVARGKGRSPGRRTSASPVSRRKGDR
eukprot:tig00020553_g10550.t1